MTGLEALVLLKSGHIVRRKSWEDNEMCKLSSINDKWFVHIIDEELDKVSDSSFGEGFELLETFTDIEPRFDCIITADEFVCDDWELVK